MKNKNIIEKEYVFEINPDKIKTQLPQSFGNFILIESKDYFVEDILIERESKPLSEDKIGIRFRMDSEGGRQLTYKKFLSKKDGLVRYDERTIDVTENDIKSFKDSGALPISNNFVLDLQEDDVFYIQLEIYNNRKLYKYTHNGEIIEVILEDITYRKNRTNVKDYMLEIEIYASSDISEFVALLVNIFSAKEVNEGKITRGLRLLS